MKVKLTIIVEFRRQRPTSTIESEHESETYSTTERSDGPAPIGFRPATFDPEEVTT